jgi:hypothetical protein
VSARPERIGVSHAATRDNSARATASTAFAKANLGFVVKYKASGDVQDEVTIHKK